MGECTATNLAALLAEYKVKCKGRITESVTAKYKINTEQYTLYYYDRSGNLVKTIPPDKRGETFNRNQTDGKYAIWGHDLSDLYLMEIEVYKTKEGKIVLRLNIES